MGGQATPGAQRPIGFWLKLVDGLIDAAFDALLGEQQFSRRHWQILNLLSQEAATTAQIDAQLAPFLTAGEATTRPVLDDLVRRGLVEWLADGRASLTSQGVDTHADLSVKIADDRRRIAAGISQDEYNATIEVLRRVAVNLGWSEPPGSSATT
jgi:DNA-binding MarR family transcriptional regulator